MVHRKVFRSVSDERLYVAIWGPKLGNSNEARNMNRKETEHSSKGETNLTDAANALLNMKKPKEAGGTTLP